MIDSLDDALRDLLIRDMPVVSNEIDIAFDPPTRDWTSRLSRPTLSIFMHDLRENNKLRTQQPYMSATSGATTAVVSMNPVRLDVHYMITAWANDPADEHRLLGRLLMVLYRYKALPEEFAYGPLGEQDFDVLLKVAQYDQRDFRREIWSMLDNEMRPIVDLTVTISFEPYEEWTVPLVRQTELSFGQMDPFGVNDRNGDLNSNGIPIGGQYYSVTGTIHGDQPFSVNLVESAKQVFLDPSGQYSITGIRGGTYTLEVWTSNAEPTHHTIEVPSNPSEYDVYL